MAKNNYNFKKNVSQDKSKPSLNASQSKKTDDHSRDIDRQPLDQMALGKRNFLYIGIAGAMIVVGFLLMLGPSSTVDKFEPDIFSTRRIVVGPLIAFLGFVALAIAIIVSPRHKKGA